MAIGWLLLTLENKNYLLAMLDLCRQNREPETSNSRLKFNDLRHLAAIL
jgi:hypothetical protein